jgi:hypothetical protein
MARLPLDSTSCSGPLKVHSFHFISPDPVSLSASCIALMMEAVSTSETSVNLYHTTQRNIPEDSHLLQNGRVFYWSRPSPYPPLIHWLWLADAPVPVLLLTVSNYVTPQHQS